MNNRLSYFSWRPTTTFMLLGGLVLLLVWATGAYIATNFKPTVEVRGGSGVYSLWLADSDAERTQGLSGVKEIPRNGGLLMKFDNENTWSIWMKDMKVPIDIVWLDKDKKVVHIVKNAQPELSTDDIMTPMKPAKYVIELNAGEVDKTAIRIGTVMSFDEDQEDE